MSRFQETFTTSAMGPRVRFGVDAHAVLTEELERLGARRALFLATPGRGEDCQVFSEAVGDLSAGVYPKARMHAPVEVSEEAALHVETVAADCLVAIGGGSTIGLGKAIALRTGLPQIAVPTIQRR